LFYVHLYSVFLIAHNGLALGAVADFGAQNCQYTTKVDASQNVQLTTSPATAPNACYGLVFFTLLVFTIIKEHFRYAK